jgi:sugar/nucleoside kinase (ribokinase family)
LGIGQNALDRICEVRGDLRRGEKRGLPTFGELPGGQVATAVLACARLGLRCRYVGKVGDDSAGPAVLAPLRAAGVDVSGVAIVPGAATQTAVILVDPNGGDRTILWHRPEALRLAAAELTRAQIAGARVLLLDSGDPEAASWAAQEAQGAGIPVVLDADTYHPDLEPLLRSVDFPLVSESFAESFCSGGRVEDCLRGLLGRGARLASVTLGDRGAVAAWGKDVIEIPAFAVDAQDTTGAGDVFHGAFAWALLAGWGAGDTLRAASAAAALNCRRPGAQGGIPDRSELTSFLAESGIAAAAAD